MRKLALLVLLVLIASLPAQNRLFVDCVHGSQIYGESDTPWNPPPIDFQAAFPDWTVCKITPDSLPIDTIFLELDIDGSQSLDYTANLPDTGHQSLYFVANRTDSDEMAYITGSITDPQGNIVSQAFNGAVHVDDATGSGWLIHIDLGPGMFHLKIGYGRQMFINPDEPDVPGKYNPLDYDAMLRVKENSDYALIGESPAYSATDQAALSFAFTQGLAFMHYWSWVDSMIDKPFVHIDAPCPVDYSVQFPGTPTFLRPIPDRHSDELSWRNIQPDSRGTTEILYEGHAKQPLGLLACSPHPNSLTLTSQAPEPLHALRFVVFDGDRYRTAGCNELAPGETTTLTHWETINPLELSRLWKTEFRADAEAVGLTSTESRHFVDELPWIEGLLHRAYENPGVFYGLYRFDQELYDQILPCTMNPAPETVVRSMWVMLSNIRDAETPSPIPCTGEATRLASTDVALREYGVTDEYYTLRNFSRDEAFFGLQNASELLPGPYTCLYYDNPVANFIAEEVTNPSVPGGYLLSGDNVTDTGIIHTETDSDHPSIMAALPMENGRLIGFGSSKYLMPDGDYPLATMSRRCLTALMDCPFFPVYKDRPPTASEIGLALSPNPFRDGLSIEYSLSHPGQVRIDLYNTRGQHVRQLVRQGDITGVHRVVWDGRDDHNTPCGNGVYLIRVTTGAETSQRKAVLLR
jgi:hypothetical protein